MMAAGGVVLPVPVPVPVPAPTRQGPRRQRRRGRQPSNGGGGIIDPISLPFYHNCMIPSTSAGLVEIENESPKESEIHESTLQDHLLNRGEGVRNINGLLKPPPDTSLKGGRTKLTVNPNSIMSRLGTGGHLVETKISEPILRDHLLNRQRGVGNGFLSPRDTAIRNCSRLRGRINPLVKANAGAHPPSERERERVTPRGIVWDRLSPEQPIHRRLRDRNKWTRGPEDSGIDRRNPRNLLARINLMVHRNAAACARLRTLVELKSSMTAENKDRPSHSLEGQRSSFEGPKPLSVIIKRKREAAGVPFSKTPIRRSLRNNRIKWPPGPEDLGIDGRNPRRSPPTQRDLMAHRNAAACARPETLAALKSGQTAENKGHSSHSLGGRRSSFEGPKPLSVILKSKREAAVVPFSKTGDAASHIKKWKGSLGGSSGTEAAETRNAVFSTPAKEIASDQEECQPHEDGHKKNREGSLGGSSGTSVAESSDAVCSPPVEVIASYYAPSDKKECKSQEDDHKKKWKGSLGGFPGTSVLETRRTAGFPGTSTAETRNPVCSPPAKEIVGDYAPSDKEKCKPQEDAHKKNWKGSLDGSSETSVSDSSIAVRSLPDKDIDSDHGPNDKEECRSQEDAHKKNWKGNLDGSLEISVSETSIAVRAPPAKEIGSVYAPSDKEECKSSNDARKKEWNGSLGGNFRTSAAENISLGGSSGTSTGETTNVVCSPLAKVIAIKHARSDKGECQSQEDALKKNRRGSLGGSYGTSFSESNNAVCSPPTKEISCDYAPSDKEECKSQEDAHKKKNKESFCGSSRTSFADASDAVCSPPAKEIASDHSDEVECKSQGVLIEAIEDHDMMCGMIIGGMRTVSISGPVVSEKLGNEGRNLSKLSENKDPMHSFGGKRNSSEGPKPCGVVLKRKREAAGVMLSEIGDKAARNKKWKGRLGASSAASAAAETFSAACSPPAKAVASSHAHGDKVERKSQGVIIEAIEDKDVVLMMIRGVRTMSISKA